MKLGAGIDGADYVLTGSTFASRLARMQAANANRGPASGADTSHTNARTVTLRKQLDKSGVTIKVKVPVAEYYGVAVSTGISDEGVLTSAIELLHEDVGLNYRVFQEEGNLNVVAEWQNWGRKLRLPLYVRSGDGDLIPYSQQVDGVLLGNSNARRKTAAESGRRPRFLNRRKPGLSVVNGGIAN